MIAEKRRDVSFLKRYAWEKLILAVLIVGLTALSFAPCIACTSGFAFLGEERQISTKGYMPLLCAALSLFELTLLFLCSGTGVRIAGLVLDLVAAGSPLPLYRGMEWLNDYCFTTIVARDRCFYSLMPMGYAILALGAVIAVFYLLILLVPAWRSGDRGG